MKGKSKKGMKTGKTAAVLLIAAALTAGLAGCGSTSESTDSAAGEESAAAESSNGLTVLNIGVLSGGAEHCLIEVGLEAGIYEEYGLELAVTEFGTGVEAITAVSMDQVDLAESMDYGAINLIGQTSSETNLRIVAQNYESSTDGELETSGNWFYVNPDVIESMDDLAGANVANMDGTFNEYLVAKTCEYAGITTEDVQLVSADTISTIVTAAETGDIDATWSTGTYANKLLELGWVALINDEEIDALTRDIAVSSETYLAENEDVLAAYFEARDAVLTYVEENTDEAAAIVSAQLALTEDDFLSTLDSYNLESKLTTEIVEAEENVAQWAYENGNFDTEFSIADFIDADALVAALPDRVNLSE